MRMNFAKSVSGGAASIRRLTAFSLALATLMVCAAVLHAGNIFIPNSSFESPQVPPVTPYAGPDMDYWQKSAQPAWYDPHQNSDTPWDYLMGQFFNVPFPGQFIENCDGNQAAFVFALPETALFQDYDTVYGTNTTPTHAFNATYNPGSAYDLKVGVLGGGGGMQPGATIEISLYYRDSASNIITLASTTVTNSPELFPTNTHLVDFQVDLPAVKQTDPWAGQHIGVQLLSTTAFALAGGYWDLDNVRLTETPTPVLMLGNPAITNGQISFTVLSVPGIKFEIQASTNSVAPAGEWTSLGTFTNVTGATAFSDSITNFNRRFYRMRQL